MCKNVTYSVAIFPFPFHFQILSSTSSRGRLYGTVQKVSCHFDASVLGHSTSLNHDYSATNMSKKSAGGPSVRISATCVRDQERGVQIWLTIIFWE